MPPRDRSSANVYRGVLSASEWDEEDNISEFVLTTDDGETFVLDLNPDDFDGADYLDATVQVAGHLKGKGKQRSIAVTSIAEVVLDDEDEAEDDDDFIDEDDFDDESYDDEDEN